MAVWREKQAQVAKEELRLKESLVKFKQEQGEDATVKKQLQLSKQTTRLTEAKVGGVVF